MKLKLFILLSGMAVFFSGCSLAPKYNRPEPPVPDKWPGGASYHKNISQDEIVDATQLDWQDFFTDPKLQQIIQLALINNRSLRLAVLNVEKHGHYTGFRNRNYSQPLMQEEAW